MTKMISENSFSTDGSQADGSRTDVVTGTRPYPEPSGTGLRTASDVENRLQDELSDDRIVTMRASAAEQFVLDAPLPRLGDLWTPGYRSVTADLARQVGLAGYEDDPFDDLPPEEPQPSSGAVDGNLVVSFIDGVTGIHKQDVLDSCLFAQLVANGKANRTQDPVAWTMAYQASLERLAWVVPRSQFVNLRSSAARFTIDQAIVHLLKGLLSGNEMEAVQNAIDAIKALPTQDRRFVIFERNSHSASAGNFQIDEVGETSGGNVQMKIGAFKFTSTESITNLLWFSFSSNQTTLAAFKSTLLLNEAVYSRVRDAVQSRLVGYASDYIGGIEFGDMG